MKESDINLIIRRFNELGEELDCGDNSCPFKKLNEYGVYGMRTNGGCRCFQEISDSHKQRKLRNLVLAVKKAIDGYRSKGE